MEREKSDLFARFSAPGKRMEIPGREKKINQLTNCVRLIHLALVRSIYRANQIAGVIWFFLFQNAIRLAFCRNGNVYVLRGVREVAWFAYGAMFCVLRVQCCEVALCWCFRQILYSFLVAIYIYTPLTFDDLRNIISVGVSKLNAVIIWYLNLLFIVLFSI